MSNLGRGLKIFFPNTPMVIKPKGNHITTRGLVEFLVPLHLTKYEIKKYLKKIYNIDVIKVNTLIHDGKMKRDALGKWYKTPAFKKAMVTIDNSAYIEERAYQQLANTSDVATVDILPTE